MWGQLDVAEHVPILFRTQKTFPLAVNAPKVANVSYFCPFFGEKISKSQEIFNTLWYFQLSIRKYTQVMQLKSDCARLWVSNTTRKHCQYPEVFFRRFLVATAAFLVKKSNLKAHKRFNQQLHTLLWWNDASSAKIWYFCDFKTSLHPKSGRSYWEMSQNYF